ncbi:rRNA maturation RNase YbeY [Marivirga salinae]|uniref:Endoribonuclease YbeY n=1 Tax=Marivirga salinarum TaxID=3059078 RepID=A0AA51REE4_9BACT|nr:rRNA maturation RNase YbeY [Marivirga sp. BDSF4-3]WMN12299.1 rRNA maturation RNase YbeY [Marivirga sp. BDSF4-3]
MDNIYFFKEDCQFDLRKLKKHKAWLNRLANHYNYEILELNYIFCSDDFLHKINLEYLDHDTYTDIITFDLQEEADESHNIESDIFISIERVKENANNLNSKFLEELARVMAHGLLHLIGFKDKTDEEKKEMRLAEDKAIELL